MPDQGPLQALVPAVVGFIAAVMVARWQPGAFSGAEQGYRGRAMGDEGGDVDAAPPRQLSPSVFGEPSRGASASPYYSTFARKAYVSPDRLLFMAEEYPFGIVTDLDHDSRDPQEFLWRSYLKTGALVRVGGNSGVNGAAGHDEADDLFEVRWDDVVTLESRTAMKNRSMELSELVRYRHLLLGVCDITGLIFKITMDGRVFQRYAVADGNGDEPKPFKSEWATTKDGLLWVGSIGKEWATPSGAILHRNAEWVKAIDANGRIENYDWGPVYQALRYATNTSSPGYLWHEAVHWDDRARRWIFLPRKSSEVGPYTEETDQRMGTNLLIVASEDFSDIRVRTIGDVEPEYGFTAVRKLPGTRDLFIALKVKEVDGVQHTKMTVFDVEGRFHLRGGPWLNIGDVKYEGLDFL